MKNVGILGFGIMGGIRARAIEAVGLGVVSKVFDPSVNGGSYNQAETMDEVIEDPNIDCIFICLPNYLIKETILKCLRNNKHIFCEKPPAMNMSDMNIIAEAYRNSKNTLMYGFNHRRHSGVIKMKELVSSGQYGRILWMRGRYGKSVDSNYITGWRANKELAGGGILLDQGIHMLDLFLHMAETDFDEVHALVSNLYWKTDGIEDNVFAMLRNKETGLCAQLHSTMTQWRHLFSLEVFLESGYMVLNGLKTNSGTYGNEDLVVAKNRSQAPAATWEDEEKFSFPVDQSWEKEVSEFFEVIEGKRPQMHGTVDNALKLMHLVDRVYENDLETSNDRKEKLSQLTSI